MTKSLAAHQVRVLVERDNLKEKYDALGTLLLSHKSREIEPEDKYLLGLQHQAMGSYLYVLNKRIERF
jgi:hypothetical protein